MIMQKSKTETHPQYVVQYDELRSKKIWFNVVLPKNIKSFPELFRFQENLLNVLKSYSPTIYWEAAKKFNI